MSTFWLAKTDVTVAAYERCVNAGACNKPNTDKETCNYGRRRDHPVNCVDWNQANAFCSWIGGRLPSAEEWEYAAKSGESRIFPWGNEPVSAQRANFCDRRCHQANPDFKYFDDSMDDGYAATSPVNAFPAGATKWGLLDMAGNVWNWTASDYDAKTKELRGGGWNVRPQALRASNRGWGDDPSYRDDHIGFRCGLPGF